MVKKHEIAHNSATVGPTNCLPLFYLNSFNNYLYTGKKENLNSIKDYKNFKFVNSDVINKIAFVLAIWAAATTESDA